MTQKNAIILKNWKLSKGQAEAKAMHLPNRFHHMLTKVGLKLSVLQPGQKLDWVGSRSGVLIQGGQHNWAGLPCSLDVVNMHWPQRAARIVLWMYLEFLLSGFQRMCFNFWELRIGQNLLYSPPSLLGWSSEKSLRTRLCISGLSAGCCRPEQLSLPHMCHGLDQILPWAGCGQRVGVWSPINLIISNNQGSLELDFTTYLSILPQNRIQWCLT